MATESQVLMLTDTMLGNTMRTIGQILIVLLSLVLTGCGYNTLQSQDEQIKANWSEVVNQYQSVALTSCRTWSIR